MNHLTEAHEYMYNIAALQSHNNHYSKHQMEEFWILLNSEIQINAKT
jgi:hypothetical protein